MTDYSKMSDAEINIEIAKIQYPKSGWNTPYSHRPDVHIYHNNGTVEVKDYCNNPADAWPIIVGSRISLTPFDDFKEGGDYIAAKYKPTRDNSKPAEVEFFCCDKPLRAAMIVFLMMKEAENV